MAQQLFKGGVNAQGEDEWHSLYYGAFTVNLVYLGEEKSRKGCFLDKVCGAKLELTFGAINIKPMSIIADWMPEIANGIR